METKSILQWRKQRLSHRKWHWGRVGKSGWELKDLNPELSAPSPVLCWVPSGHPELFFLPGLPHSPLPLNFCSCPLSTESEISQSMGVDWAHPSSQFSGAWCLGPLTSGLNSPSSILCNLEKPFPNPGFSFSVWKTASAVPFQDVCLSCRGEGWRHSTVYCNLPVRVANWNNLIIIWL